VYRFASNAQTPNNPKAKRKAPIGLPIVNYMPTPQVISKEAKIDFFINIFIFSPPSFLIILYFRDKIKPQGNNPWGNS
jgi:hypothetical protein